MFLSSLTTASKNALWLRLQFVRSLSTVRKTTKLKSLLESSQVEYIMEAHSGLSAKVVEEAGFKGIWGGGFSISAQFALRDCNEASWTQVTEVMEFMSDATEIPILMDADTGFGNFNNARRLVRKLEKIGVAGCCMEDKVFPKTNSLLGGKKKDPLANIEEFALKIKACKDHQTDPDFVVVGRTEAFNAGLGLDEVLRRAEAYRNAGADAVLVHSSKSDPSDIAAFMKVWKNQGPVVIVPTNWNNTPPKEFADMGISLVIWSSQTMRASLTAMQQVTRQIFKDQSLVNVQSIIAPAKEVFRLQCESELAEAGKKYLPGSK